MFHLRRYATRLHEARSACLRKAIPKHFVVGHCGSLAKRKRYVTMFVPHSDMRPKPLTTFAIGPSFVKPTLFNAAVIGDRDIDACPPGEHCGRLAPQPPGTPSPPPAREEGLGMRAHRKSHMLPCGRRGGQGDPGRRTCAARLERAQRVARPATTAALEMRHRCKEDANQARVCRWRGQQFVV